MTIKAIAVGTPYSASNVATASYTVLPTAATPVLSPASGAIASGTQVSIISTTSGATVYYTLDGSTPTTGSTAYTGPITVTTAETIKAIAGGAAFTPSGVASGTYTLLAAATAPVFSPNGGAVALNSTVTLTSTAGAAICYTTDGSTPSATVGATSGTLYTAPISIGAAETIKAVAGGSGFSSSSVVAASFTIEPTAATPTITPSGGTIGSDQTVSISSTSGATIYYTIDGSTPSATPGSTNGTLYTAPFSITATETVKAIAGGSGFTSSSVAQVGFTLAAAAAAPVLSPSSGAVGSDQAVSITESSSGASVYYTTDGSTPVATPGSTHGTLYSAPFSITATETVKAIAGGTGFSPSTTTVASFSVAAAASTPQFSPNGGEISSGEDVTITSSTGASIYYTTDGSTPSATPGATKGTLYTAAIPVSSAETIKAIAGGVGFSPSSVVSSAYTIAGQAVAPVITANGAALTSGQSVAVGSDQTVTITDASTNASIYYTTNGTTPNATPGALSGMLYTAPFSITGTETVQAIAGGTNYTSSSVVTANFSVAAAAATPTFSPASGAVGSDTGVTITSTNGASIYYTTDGTTPSVTPGATNGTLYQSAIAITGNETIKAIAGGVGFSPSGVASSSFSLAPTAATPTISPNGGLVVSGSTVTLSSTTGAAIYYTTDGSTPVATPGATAGTLYTTPISITAAGSITAIAGGAGFSPSAVSSANFQLGYPITGSVVSGTTGISAGVQLYAAGSTGYGAGATAIGDPVSTNASTGAYSLAYNCTNAQSPDDQLYLVATGNTATNTNIVLMTGLGSCSGLSTTGTTAQINEVTTISSVYALQQFAQFDSSGNIAIGASTGNYTGLKNAFATIGNLVNIATGAPWAAPASTYTDSASNAWHSDSIGMTPAYANGFTFNGTSYPATRYMNDSTVPVSRINTLANILATCVQSTDGNKCASGTELFDYAAVTADGTTYTKPSNTLQAAYNIAQNPAGVNLTGGSVSSPASNLTNLWSLATANTTYTPALSAVPNDFALMLTFTSGGLGGYPGDSATYAISNSAMAIDAGGDLFVSGYSYSTSGSLGLIVKLNNLGVPQTPPSTGVAKKAYTYGGFSPYLTYGTQAGYQPYNLVLDPNGMLWFSGGSYSASDISGGLDPSLPSSPNSAFLKDINAYGKGSGYFPYSLAIDGSGDAWFSNPSNDTGAFGEYSNSGTLLSPSKGDSSCTASYPFGWMPCNNRLLDGFIFDPAGNIWGEGDYSSSEIKELYEFSASSSGSSLPGTLLNTIPFPTQFTNFQSALAADSKGNIYVSAYAIPSGGLVIFNPNVSTTAPVVTSLLVPSREGLVVAVDGANHIWTAYGNLSKKVNGILDEYSYNGTGSTAGTLSLLTPTTTGLTGSGTGEATGIIAYGKSSAGSNTAGISVDGSGNLWVASGSTGYASASTSGACGTTYPICGNVLEEYVGLAAPVTTPTSVAVGKGTATGGVGQRP